MKPIEAFFHLANALLQLVRDVALHILALFVPLTSLLAGLINAVIRVLGLVAVFALVLSALVLVVLIGAVFHVELAVDLVDWWKVSLM